MGRSDLLNSIREPCSLLGRVRDACLNEALFVSLGRAQSVLRLWRDDYDHMQPHIGIGGLTLTDAAERVVQYRREGHHDCNMMSQKLIRILIDCQFSQPHEAGIGFTNVKFVSDQLSRPEFIALNQLKAEMLDKSFEPRFIESCKFDVEIIDVMLSEDAELSAQKSFIFYRAV